MYYKLKYAIIIMINLTGEIVMKLFALVLNNLVIISVAAVIILAVISNVKGHACKAQKVK